MKQKKRPPGGGTRTDKNNCQYGQYTTSRTKMQELILSFLHKGRENAMTARDIRNATGIDGRAVTLTIRNARLCGFPIVSAPECGYWISDIPAEIMRYVRRAAEILRVADALEAVARSLEQKAVTV